MTRFSILCFVIDICVIHNLAKISLHKAKYFQFDRISLGYKEINWQYTRVHVIKVPFTNTFVAAQVHSNNMLHAFVVTGTYTFNKAHHVCVSK